MLPSGLPDLLFELSDKAKGILPIYELRVLQPVLEELKRHDPHISGEMGTVHYILRMDATFLKRFAMDGPQWATFCPHPTYVFEWLPPTTRAACDCLTDYMKRYAQTIAQPLVGEIDGIEAKIVDRTADLIIDGHNEYAAQSWANDIGLIARSRAFFARRLGQSVDPFLFFHDI